MLQKITKVVLSIFYSNYVSDVAIVVALVVVVGVVDADVAGAVLADGGCDVQCCSIIYAVQAKSF